MSAVVASARPLPGKRRAGRSATLRDARSVSAARSASRMPKPVRSRSPTPRDVGADSEAPTRAAGCISPRRAVFGPPVGRVLERRRSRFLAPGDVGADVEAPTRAASVQLCSDGPFSVPCRHDARKSETAPSWRRQMSGGLPSCDGFLGRSSPPTALQHPFRGLRIMGAPRRPRRASARAWARARRLRPFRRASPAWRRSPTRPRRAAPAASSRRRPWRASRRRT